MNDGPGRLPRMPECPFTSTGLLRYYSYPTQPNVDIVHVGNYQAYLFHTYFLVLTYELNKRFNSAGLIRISWTQGQTCVFG